MKPWTQKICVGGVLFAMALGCLPAMMLARAPQKKHRAATPKAKAHRATRHRTTSRHHRSRHYTRRRSNYRRHLARLHLQPERIREIQQALIDKGYLKSGPTGRWDDATQAAMKSFQSANNFAVTGLPEAKALMMLGLGPHPLPRSLAPTPAQAEAETGSASAAGDAPSAPSSDNSRASASSHGNDRP